MSHESEGFVPMPSVDEFEERRLFAELEASMFGTTEPVELGRYAVGRRLGAGAMGVVYEAQDPRLRRKVALKVLHPDLRSTQASRGHQRLRREAQSIGRVSHPNVIEVYDVGEADGRVYIAMELVDGSSLDAWLKQEPRDWREILAVFIAAGRGLAAAHKSGVIHRDFKPSNVSIDASGRVRVLDFGLAKAGGVGPSTVEGAWPSSSDDLATGAEALVGTPRYMAPEQLQGRSAGEQSDQYAFCVALYEAVFGRVPFDDGNMLASKLAEDRVPPPGDTAVPRWVTRALQRGLHADPDRRWPSMEALLTRLGPRRSRDTMAGLVDALQQSAGRWRWPWAIAVAGLVSAVGAGVLHASASADTSAAAPGLQDGPETSPPHVAMEPMSQEASSVRRRLEQLEALDDDRRYEEAAKLSPQTLEDAEALGVPRLIAQAAVLHGRVLMNTNPHESAAVLKRAYEAAVEADDPELEQRAAFYLARLYAQKLVDPEAAALWLRHAEAAVDRLGDVPELRFAVLGLRMIVLRLEGDRVATIAASRRIVALADSQWGSKDRRAIQARHALAIALMDVQETAEARAEIVLALEAARGLDPDLEARCLSLLSSIEVLQNSDQNDPELANLAVAYAREAVEIQTRLHGAAHASAIGARRTLGNALAEAGQLKEAKAEHIAVLEGFTTLLGPESAEVGRSAAAVGTVLLDLGELAEAEAHLQRSVVSLEAAYGKDHHALATPLGYLGLAQRRLHAFERARRTYERYIVVAQESPRQRSVASEGRARVEVESGNHRAAAPLLEAAAQAWIELSGDPNDPYAKELRQLIRE